MALANLTDLTASIASWSKRSDLTSVIPDLITLAEARINRDLNMRVAEIETPIILTSGNRTVSLPSDFSTPIGLFDNTYYPRTEVDAVIPSLLPVTDLAARPKYWAVDGSTVAFDCPADATYNYTLRYVKDFALSASNPTNGVLTAHPDVYLWACMMEVASYTFDTANLPMWSQRYDSAVADASGVERASFKDVPLRTEISANGRFNIIRGY